jgi:hypothetical protein
MLGWGLGWLINAGDERSSALSGFRIRSISGMIIHMAI